MAKSKKNKQAIIPVLQGATTLAGRPINEVIQSTYNPFEKDAYTGVNSLQQGQVKIISTNDSLKYITDNGIALLLYSMHLLTKATTELTKDGYKIEIPLKEYAAQCGFDVHNEDKAKAKAELDAFRKIYKKAFAELDAIKLEWTENKGKNKGDYDARKIIVGDGLKKGVAYFIITPSIADIMISNNYITQIPRPAFNIGGRKGKSFYKKLLYKLSHHYNINHNKENGSNNILSIKTLLEWTTLPTVEHLKEINNRNYNDLILEPLYEMLEQYVTDGILTYWNTCGARKEPYTDEQKNNTPAEQQINEWYIHFEFAKEQQT